MSIYLIDNIIVPLDSEPDFRRDALKALRCKASDLTEVSVYRRSVDARKKEKIRLNYTLAAKLKAGASIPPCAKVRLLTEEKPQFRPGAEQLQDRPVIIGFGPAGMFCGLMLAREGYRPIILEQGAPMEQRVADVEAFWQGSKLNPHSNIQFGEGGAGTFSDGKLMTRINDGYCRYVLEELAAHGAPPEILTAAKPHIGTDVLRQVVVSIRREIVSLGGEVRFHTAAKDLQIHGCKVSGVITDAGVIPCSCLVLAPGNAARPLFFLCLEKGIQITSKPFSVGARIEHLQQKIDNAMYGNYAGHPRLGHAEYQLSERNRQTGRAVYTFCMCPGGFVIPAATDQQQIVVNGMSPSNRGGQWSNSGMVVEIRPEDVEGDDPLCMMRFQQQMEYDCWLQGNRKQTAPAQRMADFVNGRLSADLPRSSYAPGLISSPLHFWMPPAVSNRLKAGFLQFGKSSHGFLTNEALMIGVETRTSSPVRIVRDRDTLMHVRIRGLFPCGEGAGYAGGIVSAGVDGERCAEMCAKYLGVC